MATLELDYTIQDEVVKVFHNMVLFLVKADDGFGLWTFGYINSLAEIYS